MWSFGEQADCHGLTYIVAWGLVSRPNIVPFNVSVETKHYSFRYRFPGLICGLSPRTLPVSTITHIPTSLPTHAYLLLAHICDCSSSRSPGSHIIWWTDRHPLHCRRWTETDGLRVPYTLTDLRTVKGGWTYYWDTYERTQNGVGPWTTLG
jgi:hypothetical protein